MRLVHKGPYESPDAAYKKTGDRTAESGVIPRGVDRRELLTEIDVPVE